MSKKELPNGCTTTTRRDMLGHQAVVDPAINGMHRVSPSRPTLLAIGDASYRVDKATDQLAEPTSVIASPQSIESEAAEVGDDMVRSQYCGSSRMARSTLVMEGIMLLFATIPLVGLSAVLLFELTTRFFQLLQP